MTPEDDCDEFFDETDETEEVDEEVLDLGTIRNGWQVVCHGDDSPDCLVDWLTPFVDRHDRCISIADEHQLDVKELGDCGSTIEFLQSIGVRLTSEDWTGSLISGTYFFGWIRVGSENDVAAKAVRILTVIEKSLRRALLNRGIEQLKRIDELEKLSERITDDRAAMRAQIDALRTDLWKAIQERDEARGRGAG